MRWLAMSLIGWLSLGLCQGSEIVAWKMPSRILSEYGIRVTELLVLAEPPEPSVFFHPGDRLHRFEPTHLAALLKGSDALADPFSSSPKETKAPRITDPPPEWMVWNASTGYLVTKSDPNAFLQLCLRVPVERGPIQIRTTLTGYPLTDAGKEPSAAGKPLFQVTCLTRSGEESSVDTKNPGCAFAFKLSPVCDEKGGRVDCRLSGHFRCEGHAPIEVNAAFAVTLGQAVWIARDFDGREGLDIQACAQAEFIDGTPAVEAVLIQREGKAAPCGIKDSFEFQTQRVDETHWLTSIEHPAEVMARLYGYGQSEPEAGNGKEPPFHEGPKVIKEATVPAALRGRYPQPVWDLRDIMNQFGLMLVDEDFVGYDPKASTVFLFTADPVKVDMFEALFSIQCPQPPSQQIVVWDLLGQSRIICRSGEFAVISRMRPEQKPDQKPLRHLKVELTIGEDDTLASLRIEADEHSHPESHFSITAAHTIQTNQWKTIAESDTKGGRAECRVKTLRSE
ncbi:MAG TPA: hypothetical protein VFY13_10410 [Luteolibacter sp.]|nr:hypothetical protein [Luteolibacter sp.]